MKFLSLVFSAVLLIGCGVEAEKTKARKKEVQVDKTFQRASSTIKHGAVAEGVNAFYYPVVESTNGVELDQSKKREIRRRIQKVPQIGREISRLRGKLFPALVKMIKEDKVEKCYSIVQFFGGAKACLAPSPQDGKTGVEKLQAKMKEIQAKLAGLKCEEKLVIYKQMKEAGQTNTPQFKQIVQAVMGCRALSRVKYVLSGKLGTCSKLGDLKTLLGEDANTQAPTPRAQQCLGTFATKIAPFKDKIGSSPEFHGDESTSGILKEMYLAIGPENWFYGRADLTKIDLRDLRNPVIEVAFGNPRPILYSNVQLDEENDNIKTIEDIEFNPLKQTLNFTIKEKNNFGELTGNHLEIKLERIVHFNLIRYTGGIKLFSESGDLLRQGQLTLDFPMNVAL